jgi:hypothetical protein
MTRCIVSWDKLADMDDPIRSLNGASAALVLIHAEMGKDTLAEKAMEFMVNKIGEDARRLVDLYDSLRERIVSDRPEAVPATEPAGDDAVAGAS